MTRVDATVWRMRAAVVQALFLRRLAWLVTAWSFALGTGVLLARAVFRVEAPFAAIGAAGLPVAAAVAWGLSRRQAPAVDVLRAKLDALMHGGGLLAAGAEVDLREWTAHVPGGAVPRVRWREPRAGVLLGMGLLYAVAAFLMPVRPAAAIAALPQAIDQAVDELQRQVEALVETEAIEETRAAELARQLERLSDLAPAADPMKTWEALDHVQEAMRDLAADAADVLGRDVDEAAALAALAEAMREPTTAAGANVDLTAAMRELAELVEASELLSTLDGTLPPELAAALAASALDPARLQALAKCLSDAKDGRLAKLGKLCEAGLVDPAMLSACRAAAADGEAALAAFLDEQADSSALVAVACPCPTPGQGGVSRGRGDAPLTWTDGTDENGAAFKEEIIQPSAIGQPDQSRLVGLSSGEPESNDAPAAVTGGALAGGGEGGGAHKQRVLPQHRRAVQRYFHRGATHDGKD